MNKLIVVTGGTKGIGRAIVVKFASAGFDVATCSRNKADLAQLTSELNVKFPNSRIFTYVADMSKRNDIEAFTRQVADLGRPLDVLVNNAGYFIPGDITTEKEGTLESMIEANLYSAYHTTRQLVVNMKNRGQGHIFNMCSIASIAAYANGGSYAISKFALLGFSKCLREELKPLGIRVTAVMPGATYTASWAGTELPEERFMKAGDVAESIYSAWTLSERSVVEEILIRPQLGDL